MNTLPKLARCAVYTRKSTDHNLDLEFNSLDAQREACEAYIKSQVHEGWRLAPGHFDDGGISGASLKRPALQALLCEIQAGKIDIVVVYKVDRLTRSLTDFAKLVELFDRHDASFVSITQSFNTTTSMGRLTLNVLLSFAQFEREVIGERVRDKIAASRRKGIWMGGTVPLGYTNHEKKLIALPDEAETVRWIFQKYLELGAIGPLLQELDRQGMRTKQRVLTDGRKVGGGHYCKGGLNNLLKNRCYIGEILYKGEIHAACHEPILERSVFEAVQARMGSNNVTKRLKLKNLPYLLTGFVYDSAGNRMSPVHTLKKGVRYRYYVSQPVLQRRKGKAGEVSRVAAPDIESAIEVFLRDRFAASGMNGQHPSVRELLETHVGQIVIQTDTARVEFRSPADGMTASCNSGPSEAPTIVTLPWGRKTLSAVEGKAPTPSAGNLDLRARDAVLTAIGKARLWIKEIVAGGSLADIAKREGRCQRQIRLLAPLAFMPPGIVNSIVDEDIRAGTVTSLAKNVPLIWTASCAPAK